jgi:hypothetical protein
MGLFSFLKKIVDPVGALLGTDNKVVNAISGLTNPAALGSRRIIEGAETGGLRGAIGGLSDAAAYGAGDFISPLYTTPEGNNPIYDRVGPIMAGFFGGPLAGSAADAWASGSEYDDVANLHLGSIAGFGGEGWGGQGLFKKGINKIASSYVPSTSPVISGTGAGESVAASLPSLSGGASTLESASAPINLAKYASAAPKLFGGASNIESASVPVDTGMFARSAPNLVGGASNIESASIPISPGVDYIPPKSNANPASTGTGNVVVADTTGGTSVPGNFLSKMKEYSPYIFGASQVLNGINQSMMAKDMNEAQSKSYQDYLSLINPPEEVKQARYNILRNNVSTTASDARRRLRDTLASRGIRGRGIGGPNAALERSMMDAENNAFNTIYGTYNVPGEAPPVNYSPSAANILGKNISDIGTLMMMQNLYNNAR